MVREWYDQLTEGKGTGSISECRLLYVIVSGVINYTTFRPGSLRIRKGKESSVKVTRLFVPVLTIVFYG